MLRDVIQTGEQFSVTDRDSLHYRWHTYKKCIIDEKNKKKTQYALRDYLFKFWYEFVPKATRVIEMGQGEIYYQKAVKSVLHSFMGTVFEEMCRYYTLKQGIQGGWLVYYFSGNQVGCRKCN